MLYRNLTLLPAIQQIASLAYSQDDHALNKKISAKIIAIKLCKVYHLGKFETKENNQLYNI